jgi:hypothetical protein
MLLALVGLHVSSSGGVSRTSLDGVRWARSSELRYACNVHAPDREDVERKMQHRQQAHQLFVVFVVRCFVFSLRVDVARCERVLSSILVPVRDQQVHRGPTPTLHKHLLCCWL